MAGTIGGLIIIAIQCFFWYAQTGELLVYSYQNEGFDFSDPHFWGILFSFRKGLFIYTPVLLLVFAGLIFYLKRRSYYLFIAWIGPFLIITYVLSSWHDWVYGHSYGLRAFIDFYPLFLIPMSLTVGIGLKRTLAVVLFIMSCISLNLVQIWQYKHFILHWHTMDLDKYKKVFLRTADQYKGILWKEEFDTSDLVKIDSVETKLHNSEWYKTDTLFYDDVSAISRQGISHVRITLESYFDNNDKTLVELNMLDSVGKNLLYTRGVYLIHYADSHLGIPQTGHYWYRLNESGQQSSSKILIRVFSAELPVNLQRVRIDFFNKKLLNE